MEVTQGVQDGRNEVHLIEGKRTYVRLYGRANTPGGCQTTAHLVVRRGSVSVTLSPINPGGTGFVGLPVSRFGRGSAAHGFTFELPSDFLSGTINLLGIVNPDDDPHEIHRGNQQVAQAATFIVNPTPNITYYRVRYTIGGVDNSTGVIHALMAAGWLQRAYPIGSLDWSAPRLDWGAGRTGLNSRGAVVLTRPSCGRLNSRLLRILPWSTVPAGSFWWRADAGLTTPNRWIGMVTDSGAFMRGCSEDIPALVASGPAGTTGFAWDTDGSYADWYSGHELAHTYNRQHAPYCGAEGDRDDYPYQRGYISPFEREIEAVVGFDVQTRDLYPFNVWKDVMTYCNNQWMSDFTYERIGAFLRVAHPLRLLRRVQDPLPFPSLVVLGSIDPKTDEASLDPIFSLPPDGRGVSEPAKGKYAIVLRDAGGAELARYPFEPSRRHSGPPAGGTKEPELEELLVARVVPALPGTQAVELQGPGNKKLASINPGPSSPKVQLVTPKGGEVVGGSVHVEWQASDPDGDPLSYLLLYSPDGGRTWTPASLDSDSTSADVSRESLTAGSDARFRVVATDGLNTSFDDSDASFFVPDVPPTVEIQAPKDDEVVLSDATLGLDAFAYDIDQGALNGKAVQWFSSRDGRLGEGAQLSVTGLSPGEHTIAAFAGQSGGQPILDTVRVMVASDIAQLPTQPDGLVVGPAPIVLISGGVNDAGLVVLDRNGKGLAWNAKPSDPWISLNQSSGDVPAEIKVDVDHARLPHPLQGDLKGRIVFTSSDLPGQQWVVEVQLERVQDR